jgi:hypothetical protein
MNDLEEIENKLKRNKKQKKVVKDFEYLGETGKWGNRAIARFPQINVPGSPRK